MNKSLKSLIPSLADSNVCREQSRDYAFVGIDFGTSNTVVSVCTWDEEINDLSVSTLDIDKTIGGSSTPLIPTVIYIEGHRPLIGQNAKHRGEIDGSSEKNYLSSFKMKLGYEDGSQYHQFELGREPSKLQQVTSKLNEVLGRRGRSITSKNLEIDSPRKATEAFFSILRAFVEEHCNWKFPGKSLKYSVSIPACFGSNQRREYKIALEAAGIEVDDRFFIDEPNAAFLSWLADHPKENIALFERADRAMNALVFDFGAGTCDLSILSVQPNGQKGLKLKNLALSRFSALGGDDLDREIASSCLFPIVCERNEIEPERLPPHIYREHIEPKLKALAERLKIRASNRLNRENLSGSDRISLQLDEPIEIKIPSKWHDIFTGQAVRSLVIPEDLELTFDDFDKAVRKFIRHENGLHTSQAKPIQNFLKRLVSSKSLNQQSILDLIENVISKSGLQSIDIDYILFIGGSSNLRIVQDAVLDHFDQIPELIIPDDLQTHVSRGVALHSFLSHGLQVNPLTEILAEDIYLMVKDGERLVFKAGTEIPASNAVGSLYKTSKRQRSIELPFLAGAEKRIVARISTKMPPNVSENDEITLEAQIDTHKIVHLRAEYNGGVLLQGEEISPFGQQALDEYSQNVGALRSKLNNALAQEGFRSGEDSLLGSLNKFPKSTLIFYELLNTVKPHKDYLYCLALHEELLPDDYVNLSYYAANAGQRVLARSYKEKAYEVKRTGVSAYNLASEYERGSQIYIKYMEEACLFDYPTAKIALAEIYKERDPNRADDLMKQASNYYIPRFEADPNELAEFEYLLLKRIADYKNDAGLREQLKKSEKCRAKTIETQRREINAEKLLIGRAPNEYSDQDPEDDTDGPEGDFIQI